MITVIRRISFATLKNHYKAVAAILVVSGLAVALLATLGSSSAPQSAVAAPVTVSTPATPTGPSIAECTNFQSTYNSEIGPLSAQAQTVSPPNLMFDVNQMFGDLHQTITDTDPQSLQMQKDTWQIVVDSSKDDYQAVGDDMKHFNSDVLDFAKQCGFTAV